MKVLARLKHKANGEYEPMELEFLNGPDIVLIFNEPMFWHPLDEQLKAQGVRLKDGNATDFVLRFYAIQNALQYDIISPLCSSLKLYQMLKEIAKDIRWGIESVNYDEIESLEDIEE